MSKLPVCDVNNPSLPPIRKSLYAHAFGKSLFKRGLSKNFRLRFSER